MSESTRALSAGRVGRAHGRDGSFYVENPDHPLDVGTHVTVAGRAHRVERRGGTAERPLLRLSGVEDREAAAELSGEPLVVEGVVGEQEWLAEDLVGCGVEGLGEVRRVLDGPSCDLLELEDGTLVPLVSDAVRRVDVDNRAIEIDRRFLGLEK